MTLVPIKSSEKSKNPFAEPGGDLSGRSARALRCVGYGLLLLSLLDWIVIVFPPQLMDPAWEFQTIGALVERVPVPLIGLAMVFYGEFQQRSRWESPTLKGLSWLSFALGLLFFALVPLGVIDTSRLLEQSDRQLANSYEQQLAQVKQVEERLSKTEPSEINKFLQDQGVDPGKLTPEDVRKQALGEIQAAKGRSQIQLEAEKKNRLRSLLENSVKWNLGAAIGGTCFVYLWRVTRWARVGRRRR